MVTFEGVSFGLWAFRARARRAIGAPRDWTRHAVFRGACRHARGRPSLVVSGIVVRLRRTPCPRASARAGTGRHQGGRRKVRVHR